MIEMALWFCLAAVIVVPAVLALAAWAKTPTKPGMAECCQRLGCRFEVAQSMLDRAKERGELSEAERAALERTAKP